jgi:hypothetical protein
VLAAVHQAGSTLTTIAAVDYTQIRAAGLSGRLLAPIVKPGNSSQVDQTFVRAPRRHVNALLNAYRDAGTASVKATAKIAEAAAHAKALDRERDRSQIAKLAARGWHARWRTQGDPPVAAASSEAAQESLGPVERILRELGVTDQVLLNRGLALDGATSKLVAEAAQQTAPQRWNVAVKDLSRHHDASQIIDHVLAQNEAALAVCSSSRAAVVAQLRSQPRRRQAEQLQAEP